MEQFCFVLYNVYFIHNKMKNMCFIRGLVVQWLQRRTCNQQVTSSIPGRALPVSTWMSDRLRAGKPSRYVTSHLGQLSLPSLGGR